MAFYLYTISVDVTSGSVDTSLLTQEIINDPIVPASVSYVRVDGDTLRVDFGAVTLNATEKSALDALVQNHPTETEDSDAGTTGFSRQVDPTSNDDANDGIQVGDIWVNEATDTAFICVDSSPGAAQWDNVSTVTLQGTAATLDNLAATTDPDVNNDSTQGYEVGSHWTNVTTDEMWACVDATPGAAKWKTVTDAAGASASAVRPGTTFLGGLLDYTGSDVETSNEITFVRNWYSAGTKLLQMEIFPTQVGGSSRTIHLGVYNQVTPTSSSEGPNVKVAEITPVVANTVVVNTFNKFTITTPGGGYTIPTTGYYWHAFLSQGTGGPGTKIKPTLTGDYVSGFTPVRFKAGQTTLPATAGAVSTAGGALIYIAGVE